MANKKILIIQTAFIGDVILTTPLIESLHKTFHEAQIDFLTIPSSENLISAIPHISNTIIFDKRGKDSGLSGLVRMANYLKHRSYDICLTPHRSFRSAFLSFRSGAKYRIGFDRSAWKGAFTHLIRYQDADHEIERNLSLLGPLDINWRLQPPQLYATDADFSVVRKLMDRYASGKPLMAVAPGSVWATKRWPENYFARICTELTKHGFQMVLVGSKEDAPLCQRIADQADGAFSLAGELTLRQTYQLLTRCKGILTNDSAPLHMGMAARIPVFALFGPTVPSFGFAPFGPKGLILEIGDLKCRPCAIHGGNKCPIKTFDCMNHLTPEMVLSRILDKLDQLNKPKRK